MRDDMVLRDSGATQSCDACQMSRALFEYRYCESVCLSDGEGGWLRTQTVGETGIPHLHMKCGRCGFSWLESPAHAARTRSGG